MRLEAIDLNLLLCLGHLLEEASVSGAARKMGVTQPTMSHRLTQLRELLDDPVLVRSGRRMQLTPAAERIQPRVRAALAAARDVLIDPAGFDPAEATGAVRIAAMDYEAITLVEPLVTRLGRLAPQLDLRLGPAGPRSGADLASGSVDLIVGPGLDKTMPLPDEGHQAAQDLVFRRVFEDRWCCVVRAGHPRGLGPVTLDELVALPHAVTAFAGGERSFFDAVLVEHDAARRVAVTTPSFTQTASMVVASDLLALLPETFARRFAGLQLYELPVATPPITVGLWWHPRNTREPRHRWLRGLLRDIGEGLAVA